MTKRALTILIATLVIVGFAAVAIAGSVGSDSDTGASHVMPDGQTMEGAAMGADAEPPTHTMEGGEVMEGSTMPSGGGSGMDGG